jgi:hypothetical protein
MPFRQNVAFELIIVRTDRGWAVTIDGRRAEAFDFVQRVPGEVAKVALFGDGTMFFHPRPRVFRSCADVHLAQPQTSSGPQIIAVSPTVTRRLFCDMDADGGGWTLVAVVTSDSKSDCDKYPVNGQNVELLANRAKDWASLSKSEMDYLWNQMDEPVMKIESFGSVSSTHYIQRKANLSSFSAFHAIRDVREWGECASAYSIAASNQGQFYDSVNHRVSHDGACMKHFEDNEARCNGQRFTVSRHGVTGDHKGGCEWLYTFEASCQAQTASYCFGTCHNDNGYGSRSEQSPNAGVTTWIWLKGAGTRCSDTISMSNSEIQGNFVRNVGLSIIEMRQQPQSGNGTLVLYFVCAKPTALRLQAEIISTDAVPFSVKIGNVDMTAWPMTASPPWWSWSSVSPLYRVTAGMQSLSLTAARGTISIRNARFSQGATDCCWSLPTSHEQGQHRVTASDSAYGWSVSNWSPCVSPAGGDGVGGDCLGLYQAEDAALSGGPLLLSNHLGYTGQGSLTTRPSRPPRSEALSCRIR